MAGKTGATRAAANSESKMPARTRKVRFPRGIETEKEVQYAPEAAKGSTNTFQGSQPARPHAPHQRGGKADLITNAPEAKFGTPTRKLKDERRGDETRRRIAPEAAIDSRRRDRPLSPRSSATHRRRHLL